MPKRFNTNDERRAYYRQQNEKRKLKKKEVDEEVDGNIYPINVIPESSSDDSMEEEDVKKYLRIDNRRYKCNEYISINVNKNLLIENKKLKQLLLKKEVDEEVEEVYTTTYNSGKYVLREDYDKLYEECKRFQEKGLEYKRLALCYEKNIQNELIYYYKMKHYKLYWYCLREIEDEPNIEWVDIKYHLGVKRSLIEERDLYYNLKKEVDDKETNEIGIQTDYVCIMKYINENENKSISQKKAEQVLEQTKPWF
jgi:hypothetical protein